jgi:hypothetical protein
MEAQDIAIHSDLDGRYDLIAGSGHLLCLGRGVCSSSGIHRRVLLDERDSITTPLVLAILNSGMAGLTPIHQDLLSGFFLAKIRAPMRSFKTKYSMSSLDVHAEIGHALNELRHHFKRDGISHPADFCTD